MKLTIVLAATCSVLGCSSQSGLTVTEPVGPGISTTGRNGALQIYTATEEHPDGDNTYYYPHTGYHIYDDAGKEIKYVFNHVGTMDETPSVVDLSPGSYKVAAQAEAYGRVRIPVIIKARCTTIIHLERGWKPPENAKDADLVRMPDGQPIGWRADRVNHNEVSSNSQHRIP